jgi:iron complex transport system ATP-binding protein
MEISCRNLSIGFGVKNRLVEKFDLSFQAGNFSALIGRNGSGKSTLLKHFAGLYKALEGDILLNGTSISLLSANEMARKICWIGTEKIDFPFLKVWEFVALGRHPYLGITGFLSEADNNIIDNALAQMGIVHLRNKFLKECSDGERQSSMLARALAQDTAIILLDEITAHLDYVHRHRSFELLRKLAKENNKLIILATHEIDLSLKYCDELIVLHKQKIQKIEAADYENKDLLSQVFEGLVS